MVVIYKILFISIYFVSAVVTNVLPVGKCSLQDSNCLIREFQNAVPTFMGGLPDMDIDVLDVMKMDEVNFDLSGLQFNLKDGHLKGLKTSLIKNVNWDTKKNKLSVDFLVNCTIKGHYKASGRVLILPITGDGQMKLKLRDVDIKIQIEYNLVKGEDGKNKVVPKKLHFDFDVLGNAHFSLTNLFNGNKELSSTMLNFLNENWKQVSVEFGRPIMAVAAKQIYSNIVKFFAKSPIDDITI